MNPFKPSARRAVFALAGLALVQSHGIMNTPQPYNLHPDHTPSDRLLQQDPLGPNFPFPCQRRTEHAGHTTQVTAGDTVFVNFTIGADHYGGTCQFSVTYDDPPPADKSRWKTIYTIVGGCPVSRTDKSLHANLPAAGFDSDGRPAIKGCGNGHDLDCVREFDIPFPRDMPNGKATFAWTWFNYVGNREMYMNCAPVEVTGGADNSAFFDDLPEMFVANIEGECNTLTQGILYIPHPGKYGKFLEPRVQNAQGTCGEAAAPSFEEGGSDPPKTKTTGSNALSTTSTTDSSSPTTTTTTTTKAHKPETKTAETTLNTGTYSSTSVTTVNGASETGAAIPGRMPCTASDGTWMCFGNGMMGMCDHGQVQEIRLADGMMCLDGAYVAASSRRARAYTTDE